MLSIAVILATAASCSSDDSTLTKVTTCAPTPQPVATPSTPRSPSLTLGRAQRPDDAGTNASAEPTAADPGQGLLASLAPNANGTATSILTCPNPSQQASPVD
jgi:hypothetical protein